MAKRLLRALPQSTVSKYTLTHTERGITIKERTFQTADNKGLVVKHRKSAIFLELAEDNKGYHFDLLFSPEIYRELVAYFEKIATESWENVIPKEAMNMGSDYDEYYDREFDNNGSLAIGNHHSLHLSRPVLESTRLYKFNKRKMESFLFDLQKQAETGR